LGKKNSAQRLVAMKKRADIAPHTRKQKIWNKRLVGGRNA